MFVRYTKKNIETDTRWKQFHLVFVLFLEMLSIVQSKEIKFYF